MNRFQIYAFLLTLQYFLTWLSVTLQRPQGWGRDPEVARQRGAVEVVWGEPGVCDDQRRQWKHFRRQLFIQEEGEIQVSPKP